MSAKLRRSSGVKRKPKPKAARDEKSAASARPRRSKRRAEAQRQRAEDERLRTEAEAKRRAEEEERRRLRRLQRAPAVAAVTTRAAVGSLLGVAALGAIGVWLAVQPAPVPRRRAPPAPVTPDTASVRRERPTDTPLSPAQEQALKPRDTFKECTNCPQMMVVPAGSFTMGSPASEPGRSTDEGPQHTVTIARQFAVGQFELTFDEWDACVADGGCNGYKPSDARLGPRPPAGDQRVVGRCQGLRRLAVKRPASRIGCSPRPNTNMRRAPGRQTAYPWGNAIGKNNANCDGCGSQWDNKQTAPVGSFAPNGFGLYDMVGNVWEWTEDCYHDSYDGAPADGSAWTGGDCSSVSRGGSWEPSADRVRLWIPPAIPGSSAPRYRLRNTTDYRVRPYRLPGRPDASYTLNSLPLYLSWVQGEALVEFF